MIQNSSLLEKQLNVVSLRWPDLYRQLEEADTSSLQVSLVNNTTLSVNGVQLTSAWDREAEAKLQAKQILPGQPVIYLYGSGLGDCAQTLLLRNNLQHLHVILLNRAVFLLSLAVEEQQWLNDTRVELHLPQELPEVQLPFIANPAELLLAEENSFILKDRLELELNSSYISRKHREKDSISQQRIMANHIFLEQDSDISALHWQPQKTVFVAAAGPTLEDHFHWLATHHPPLIAVDAAVAPLVKHGITPDIVVSIDPWSLHLFNDTLLAKLQNTTLVYFPSVESTLLERWQGERYYSCGTTPMYQNLPAHFRKTALFSAGSVLHPAVDLASQKGAKKIILMGADFSFVDNKSHATAEKSDENTITAPHTHFVINSLGEKVPTIQNLTGYLRDLERYIARKASIEFFNASEKGAKIMGTELWQP